MLVEDGDGRWRDSIALVKALEEILVYRFALQIHDGPIMADENATPRLK
jgi:hypothetical protein